MAKPRSSIKITTNPVADAYRSTADVKRIEFSATRRDVQEDGSYNTLMGGLISFRVIRSEGPGSSVPEDRLIVTVYRTDANVEVSWERPEPPAADDEDDDDDSPRDGDGFVTLSHGRYYVSLGGANGIQPDSQPANGYPKSGMAVYELARSGHSTTRGETSCCRCPASGSSRAMPSGGAVTPAWRSPPTTAPATRWACGWSWPATAVRARPSRSTLTCGRSTRKASSSSTTTNG
jgi:hypothetical protein